MLAVFGGLTVLQTCREGGRRVQGGKNGQAREEEHGAEILRTHHRRRVPRTRQGSHLVGRLFLPRLRCGHRRVLVLVDAALRFSPLLDRMVTSPKGIREATRSAIAWSRD